MFFSYTKSDFDCEYTALNPLIFKSVYACHNVLSDVVVGVFKGDIKSAGMVQCCYYAAKIQCKLPQKQSVIYRKYKV